MESDLLAADFLRKEVRKMMMLILLFALLFGVVRIGLSLAWGTFKFMFGLGLFWLCPLLFVLAVFFGAFSHMWLPIIIIGLLFGRGFRRAL